MVKLTLLGGSDWSLLAWFQLLCSLFLMASFWLKAWRRRRYEPSLCPVGLLEDWLFVAHRDSYTIVDCHWQSSTQWGLLSFSAIQIFCLTFSFVSLLHIWILFLLVMNLFVCLNFFMVYTLRASFIVLAWAGSRIWHGWFLLPFFSWMKLTKFCSALLLL